MGFQEQRRLSPWRSLFEQYAFDAMSGVLEKQRASTLWLVRSAPRPQIFGSVAEWLAIPGRCPESRAHFYSCDLKGSFLTAIGLDL